MCAKALNPVVQGIKRSAPPVWLGLSEQGPEWGGGVLKTQP